MPNHCFNRLTVQGKPEELKKFTKAVYKDKEDVLDLNGTVPMPKELVGTESPSDKPNWYDWAISNWGTKWGAYDASIQNETDDWIEYEFSSAWSPPLVWLETTVEMYPELNFMLKYEEDGMGFMGRATGEGGDFNDQCI